MDGGIRMAKAARKKPKKPAKGKLAGKTVALVGKFGYSDYERPKYETLVTRAGGRLVDPAKTDPDYLFVGEGRGGKPPGVVAQVQKRHAAVQVFDLAGIARFMAPTKEELLAEIKAGEFEDDRWEELDDLFRQLPAPLDLSRSDFRKAKLLGAHLRYTLLTGCDFRAADLSYAEVAIGHAVERAKFDDTNLYAAKVQRSEGCTFRGADLHETWLGSSQYGGARHVRADFRRAKMHEASVDRGEFVECTFREADLTDADLDHSTFVTADFIGANLTRAHATEARLERANFTGATLQRADLRNASLVGADLTRADLREAVLTGADLTGAKVDGADFAGAVLTGATLKNADMSKAKNFHPPVVRTPGPNLQEFAKLSAGSKNFKTTADVDLGMGEYAELELESAVRGGRRYTTGGSRYHRDGHQSFDWIDAPTVEQGLINLAERWPKATLRLDSIKVKGAGALRGKKLQELTLAAWSEAFGIQAASADELAMTKASQQAAVQHLREAMLAELRGGPVGIEKWNARPARDKTQIGPLTGVDLSRAKLDGLV